ncbi:hypothetical protein [Streptomyces sp. NPDC006527]|uniref:hypothetical protein n=1 Tax=Streptomyces sp. NPDC006527 TaxID=3364749 RepID=UPI00367515E6
MNAQRARRLFAISAVGVLMGGGAAVGAAGTASAAAPSDLPTNHSRDWCDRDRHHDWWGHDCDFRDDFDDGSVVVIVVG